MYLSGLSPWLLSPGYQIKTHPDLRRVSFELSKDVYHSL